MTASTGTKSESAQFARPLAVETLFTPTDANQFRFKTTAELDELTEMVGQSRAVEAVEFGVDIDVSGYNLFVLGPQGTGRHSFIHRYLSNRARNESPGSDWCYLNDFDDPQRPKTLELPAGRGCELKQDIDNLIDEAYTAIPAAFEGKDYRKRREAIEQQLEERQAELFEQVHKHAEERGIAVITTPTGIIYAPVKDHTPLSPRELARLPEKERKRIEKESKMIGAEMSEVFESAPQLVREVRAEIRSLDREVAMLAAGSLVGELSKKYESLPNVIAYLDGLQDDIIQNVGLFLVPQDQQQITSSSSFRRISIQQPGDAPAKRRYRVNVIIGRERDGGAPLIFEDHPTYPNLIGQIEYVAQMGTLVTDFSMIRGGALHRANGGYLVLEAQKLLTEPFAWQGLKQALRNHEVKIESLGAVYGLVHTASLKPQPIPLKTKVVLIGSRFIYYLLLVLDPEFQDLFKIAADFDDRMERDDETVQLFARLMGTIAAREELVPLRPDAVARLIDESARYAGHNEKLSGNVRFAADLLREAHHFAAKESCPAITAGHVARAVEAKERRRSRLKERIQDEILEDTLAIATTGETVGQINGLSILQLGDYAFARPSRITARVSLGAGKVVDIERESKLGGPIHSKGVLILQGYMIGRYVTDRPLSLAASIVMEQSYSGVEGDSASSAELYALLSALADAPIRQGLAVTGSINQQGAVQAVGGVSQKIEGFFEICKARGLTGGQGVLIPAANVRHLMLREEVRDAVRDGAFHIYAVRTADEGISLLTGIEAGERGGDGKFPKRSLNHRVEERLIDFAQRRQAFMREEIAKAN